MKVTTIYVTHDQAEALAVSDRIAVMSMGRMRQLGTPREIYERPADSFVADFIGSSNFFDGTMVENGADKARIRLADGSELVTPPGAAGKDGSVVVAIRPEKIELTSEAGPNTMRVSIDQRTYLGSVWQYAVRSGPIEFRVQTPSELKRDSILVRIPQEHCAVFPDKPGAN